MRLVWAIAGRGVRLPLVGAFRVGGAIAGRVSGVLAGGAAGACWWVAEGARVDGLRDVLLIVMVVSLLPLLVNLRTTDPRKRARAVLWAIAGALVGGAGNLAVQYVLDGSWWLVMTGSAMILLLALTAIRAGRVFVDARPESPAEPTTPTPREVGRAVMEERLMSSPVPGGHPPETGRCVPSPRRGAPATRIADRMGLDPRTIRRRLRVLGIRE